MNQSPNFSTPLSSPVNKVLFNLSRVLPWSLLIFAASFYCFPSSKSINNWFYVAVALPALLMLFSRQYRHVITNRLIIAIGIFAACLLLSTAFNLNPSFDPSDHVKPILYVLLFAIAYLIAYKQRPDLNALLITVVIGSAFIAATYTIFEFYEPRNWKWRYRLSSSAGISNPIWLSGIYSAAILFSVSRFIASKGSSSYIYLIAAVPPIMVALLSQSRGPLVGLIVALCVLCIFVRNRRSITLISIALLTLSGSATYFLTTDHSTRYLQPPKHRLTIWENAVDKIAEAPVIGHGLHVDTQNESKGKRMEHYHNVYLTTAVQGGTLSFAILLTICGLTLFKKVTPETEPLKLVLILGMVYMMSNGSSLFTSPKELWLLFWLPIIAIWADNSDSMKLNSGG